MKFQKTQTLNHFQKCQLLDMWHEQYPESLDFENIKAFDFYLKSLTKPQHTLLVDENKQIKGWLVKMIKDKQSWIALILDKSVQFQGWGSQLLERVKSENDEILAWVVDHNEYKKHDGNYYQSPLKFYLKNGFVLIPDDRLEQPKITAVKVKWRRA